MDAAERQLRIGIVPGAELDRRARLLAAFAEAYPVAFEARPAGALEGLDAVVTFGSADGSEGGDDLPRLTFLGEETARGASHAVALAADPALSRPLHGATLSEARAAPDARAAPEGAATLATIDGRSVWSVSGPAHVRHHTVTTAPAELAPGDTLRSRLAPGRCLGVLALAQFLVNLTAGRRFDGPPLRAAFVIDDPNLRRPTYGHIGYRELAASAAAADYHVSIAMVPLDGRTVHPAAVRLFAECADRLSLCVHGNNHVRGELSHTSPARARVPAAQAIVRSEGLERRTGLTVDRVMVAPHERLGQATAAALFAHGFEAFSGSRPYPWLDAARDLDWLGRPADSGPLVGWREAEIVDGGLLALLRLDFRHPREELAIRAFLGQPIIMYGHDDLLRGGPGELERTADEVNRLGDVRWQGLGEIARSSFTTRRDGDTLTLRMAARRARLDIPEGVSWLRVERGMLPVDGGRLSVAGALRSAGSPGADGTLRFAVARPGVVEIALPPSCDPRSVPLPRPSVRTIARRLAAEGRDRTRPRIARVR